MAAPLTVSIAQAVLRSHEKSQSAGKESVAAIPTRCKTSLIADWLTRTKKTPQLNHLNLSDEERTGHLPRLVDDLFTRLGRPKLPDKDSDAIASPAAIQHGKAETDARLFFRHAGARLANTSGNPLCDVAEERGYAGLQLAIA
jgi:hypothetical protein